MDFNKIVLELLAKDERSISWLARKLNKSRQNMASILAANNPTSKMIEDVAGVFNMKMSEFVELGEV